MENKRFEQGIELGEIKDYRNKGANRYVAEILKKFDLVNVKAAITPMETKLPLTKDEEAFDVDVHLYRSMIGSLMYLTASRPDIMYAVCVCSRFQVTPKTSHLNAVKRIFKYLKGKPNLGLWYPRESPFDLEAFSDSDYGGSNLDRKSTTGGCQFLGQRLISWQCKKQTIVATSTTEAEYVAAANCCGQVLWVQNQLLDYGFNFMNTKIHIDNESTICIVKNPVYHSKTKHIEIRHHFIRDCYEKKLISVEKIHTYLNVADLLTKPFDGPRFNYLVVSIGIAWMKGRSAKITQLEIPTHQMNTKFVNNLPAYWGKYVTNVKQNMDISTTPYVQIYTHLKAYEPHAKKTLKKQEQSTSIVDPLAYVAHTTSAPALSSPSTPSPQPTAQSPNDALMATMTQIANLLSGFQKQFPPTNNQLRTSSNSKTHATVHDGQIVTEPIQRKAPGNVGNTGARGKKVICYNCRGEGHVARQCKEPKRKMDSQYFKDKALLMEAKEKGDVLDAEAEAFLADVECTAPYDQPQALTTTNMFQANHEDAYDSDVDEGPNAAVAFMANLSSTSATNNPVNEVHSNDNQIFDNVDYQIQEMHQEEHLDSDAETEIDDNTIPYHQYLLDTEAQNVPTEVSADTSDKISMIAILTDLQTQLDGHAKVNQEKCLEIETLKNELLQCKQEICRLDTHKVKLDLENKVRQEQALVIQRNKRNAELVQENDLLKSTLSGKEKSIAFLQSEKEKILSEKKDLADSYLDEIVCLKTANKVARDMLQRFNMPTQTIPMLSKKPKKATADLHKDILGTRNPGLGYMAKRAQPVLYDADTLLHPNHHPVSIWDSEEVLVHQVVSMKKMNEKPGHVRPANDFYAKLNALMFVPQKDLSGDQAYWLSANEIASQASKSATPATPFVHKSRPPSQVLASLQKVNAVFPQFEGIIKERTTQKPDYVSEWCYDYAKQFVEQQLVPFYDHFKKHIQAANDTFFKEIKEFEQIFDELEAEYEQCVLDNKNLTIEKKNLLIRNDGLIAECLEKDICSIVLTSDIVVPPSSNCLCEELRSNCDREHSKVVELEAEILKKQQMLNESEKRCAFIEKNHVNLQVKFQKYKECLQNQRVCDNTNSTASNAIFEINKLKDQLQGKDDTIRNLQTQINITRMLNVGSTVGSFDKQALETEITQLKDALTSVRIQIDGYKAENVNLKRRYEELSKSNAYSRSTFTAKINALTAENAKLKTELSGKKTSGSTASEKPKVLASGMYTNSSKYVPPPKRANWVKPTPLPKKKQVTFQEPPRTSNRPTQKPPVQQNKKPNVSVNLSTRTRPATESRKPMPKSHTRNHRILQRLNVVDHNQFVIRSLKSVNTKTPQAKHSVNHTKQVWKATRNHNVNTTKTAWRPTRKVVGSVKPQSKGRTVADSIAERLTRPTAYKFKTDCSIIPVWITSSKLSDSNRYEHVVRLKISVLGKVKVKEDHTVIQEKVKLKHGQKIKYQDQVITSSSEDHGQGVKD
ncbi:retrovirus-related pol polyprotein from transposon TNT 1-94 [Tanacetum coccineum]|uniref:Retrovirus-related pol polyprotein from transposon TNT 1-94 n=1 Tax=Tanacetum coccineum TaxID=301880 RepID=A0ABQ5J832_9ASTR